MVSHPGLAYSNATSQPLDVPASGETNAADTDSGDMVETTFSPAHDVDTAVTNTAKARSVVDPATDQRLVSVRLGRTLPLFLCLTNRNAAAGSHSLGIALTCSAWALCRDLDTKERGRIEIAALLHDVGMIAVPDQILLKPGKLTSDEAMIVSQGRKQSREILRASCVDEQIVEIVAHVAMPYDGRGRENALCNEAPLGARMVAIAEAFDAMITDKPYRSAMSPVEAIAELERSAGTQFDAALVHEFVKLRQFDQSELRQRLARMWLAEGGIDGTLSQWPDLGIWATDRTDALGMQFGNALLANTRDAVICVNRELRILAWNSGAEQLTGISTETAQQLTWSPRMLHMWDDQGLPVRERSCPLQHALTTDNPSTGQYSIQGGDNPRAPVEIQAIPVSDYSGVTRGVAVLLRDKSAEVSLEKRCHELSNDGARDALTRCANRTAFDSECVNLLEDFRMTGTLSSMIICDLDHFKSVNDTYGHQAGDDVIVSLAQLLRDAAGPRDLAARYGGEEFVLLCSDCDIETGTKRAEGIRRDLSRLGHTRLGGRKVTASFGIAQVQPGDNAETWLHRADCALLMAKEGGRNRIIRLGGEDNGGLVKDGLGFLRRWFASDADVLLEHELTTPGPLSVCLEKLRGFVADHGANILAAEGDTIELKISSTPAACRRQDDRSYSFKTVLRFTEVRRTSERPDVQLDERPAQIRISVMIMSRDVTDRRRTAQTDHAMAMLSSLQAYLMARRNEYGPANSEPGETRSVTLPSFMGQTL